ncbi:M23 family metallopeptidase [Zemynaea arenosa]|nr:M23 family metallopeptidase [Massilia arenosa]
MLACAACAAEPPGCVKAADLGAPRALPAASADSLLPVQLRMEVPVAPAPLPSMGRSYLYYELHLQSFSSEAMMLISVETIVPGARTDEARVIARSPAQVRELGPRQGAVVFLCLAFDGAVPVPDNIQHRVLLADGTAVAGAPLAVVRGPLPVLGAPLAGPGWTAGNGPSLEAHHRIGVLVLDGRPWLARRYAIDWKKYRNGRSYAGDARDVHSYFAYGEKVFAVADGMVVVAQDGQPDNVPRTAIGFTPAVPLTMENLGGNMVTLGLGGGRFATYAHLQPGSVRVQAGDRVRRGQWLGRIGGSGDAREPHLHFQVTDGPAILASEGLPYVLDRYHLGGQTGGAAERRHEFPLGEPEVDFAKEVNDERTQ